VAVELGLHGSTEHVTAHVRPQQPLAWAPGQGREAARELLGGGHPHPHPHTRSDSQQQLFRIADAESDE